MDRWADTADIRGRTGPPTTAGESRGSNSSQLPPNLESDGNKYVFVFRCLCLMMRQSLCVLGLCVSVHVSNMYYCLFRTDSLRLFIPSSRSQEPHTVYLLFVCISSFSFDISAGRNHHRCHTISTTEAVRLPTQRPIFIRAAHRMFYRGS